MAAPVWFYRDRWIHSFWFEYRFSVRSVAAAQAKLDAAQVNVRAAELYLKQLVETELLRAKASLRDADLQPDRWR